LAQITPAAYGWRCEPPDLAQSPAVQALHFEHPIRLRSTGNSVRTDGRQQSLDIAAPCAATRPKPSSCSSARLSDDGLGLGLSRRSTWRDPAGDRHLSSRSSRAATPEAMVRSASLDLGNLKLRCFSRRIPRYRPTRSLLARKKIPVNGFREISGNTLISRPN
jgi:hypothetical protein